MKVSSRHRDSLNIPTDRELKKAGLSKPILKRSGSAPSYSNNKQLNQLFRDMLQRDQESVSPEPILDLTAEISDTEVPGWVFIPFTDSDGAMFQPEFISEEEINLLNSFSVMLQQD